MQNWENLTLLTSWILAINLSYVIPSSLPIQIRTILSSPSLPPSRLVYVIHEWSLSLIEDIAIKMMKIKKMCRLMLFGKLWRWGWEEIFLEPLMHNSVFCRLPSCYFFCCVIMLSFNCDRNHCKMKIVFLNFYNIRTYNFNLVKSLSNTCNEVSFLLKRQLPQSYFSKNYQLYLKDIAYISKILFSFNNTYFKHLF